ncbi:hypothetical protein HELRODRAFT_194875 [Helobdella robusta]|uniref:Fibronectin type-III domain-containing protein n=1 Tax=Helobdella robusta TaxID=6412 RepID=T1FWI5_HELRO|nr:hypothetical protein HELRODRAFT_194875 [Helobdella robusta]ESO11219.1 hypothetical protein HELRODRAFT_194875 [Helobdella robusta]
MTASKLTSRGNTSTSPPVASVFVDWMPEACIADQSSDDELSKRMSINVKTTSFVIYDLRYDCRYLVELHPMSTHGIQGSITRRTFNTPSCSEAIIVGKHRPECSNNEDRWSTTPLNLQHSFFISSSNITAKIFWENNQSKQHTSSSSSSTSSSSSSSSLDNLASSSSSSSLNYRITWNPSGEPSSSITRILPGGTTSHVITDLREGTKYTVKLQRLGRHSSNHPSTIHINTPLLQHKHHQQLFGLYRFRQSGLCSVASFQNQTHQTSSTITRMTATL